MPRHTAQQGTSASWDIAEIDADGIGARRLYVGHASGAAKDAEKAARLLVLAMNLPGGLDAAIVLLRAELARQS